MSTLYHNRVWPNAEGTSTRPTDVSIVTVNSSAPIISRRISTGCVITIKTTNGVCVEVLPATTFLIAPCYSARNGLDLTWQISARPHRQKVKMPALSGQVLQPRLLPHQRNQVRQHLQPHRLRPPPPLHLLHLLDHRQLHRLQRQVLQPKARPPRRVHRRQSRPRSQSQANRLRILLPGITDTFTPHGASIRTRTCPRIGFYTRNTAFPANGLLRLCH